MESPYMRFFITSKIAERRRFFEVGRRQIEHRRDYLPRFVIVSSVIIYLRCGLCGLRSTLLHFLS